VEDLGAVRAAAVWAGEVSAAILVVVRGALQQEVWALVPYVQLLRFLLAHAVEALSFPLADAI
jgi:hypothetical protein